MNKLFIGGFPLDLTEVELVQLVDPHATVSTIKIVRDKKTGTCKGYAFLEVANAHDAAAAASALDGLIIGDRPLSVKPATEKPASAGGPQTSLRVKRPRLMPRT